MKKSSTLIFIFSICILSFSILAQGGLVRIEIVPDNFSILPGYNISFIANGYDENDNIVPLINPDWDGTGGILNPIFNTCNYEATTIGSHWVSCSKDGLIDSAFFNVVGPLNYIVINPDTAELNLNEAVELTATGFDEFNNPVALPGLTWSTTGGTIEALTSRNDNSRQLLTPDGYKATFTASENGIHTVTATSGSISNICLMIVVYELMRIIINPYDAMVNIGNGQQYTAVGEDAVGNTLSISPTWETDGGSITTEGFFIAGINAGDFTIKAKDKDITGMTLVSIPPNPLKMIDVSPPNQEVKINEQKQYSAIGLDEFGNSIEINPLWDATGGIIDLEGLFTAGTEADVFTVTASDLDINGSASVTVLPDPLDKITIDPDFKDLQVGVSFNFSAKGEDKYKNNVDFVPGWEAESGDIDISGRYTPTEEGDFAIFAYNDIKTIWGEAHVNVYSVGTKDDFLDNAELVLFQNSPNPFYDQTNINFSLKNSGRINLNFYNIVGKKYNVFNNKWFPEGDHNYLFKNKFLKPGTYFYELRNSTQSSIKKMIVK